MAEDIGTEDPFAEATSNRTFVILAVALGGLLVLSLVGLGLYAFYIAPNQLGQRQVSGTETAVAFERIAQERTATASSLLPPETVSATSTHTPSPAPSPTTESITPTPTAAANLVATATAAAGATQAALQIATTTPTPTALPTTGFGEGMDLPALATLALSLIAVVFFARRARGGLAEE
jgi:LPXTG-motif cell wall-anchored protein